MVVVCQLVKNIRYFNLNMPEIITNGAGNVAVHFPQPSFTGFNLVLQE